jgi:hypothetical protein
MLVLAWMLMWTVYVALPYALVALALGRWAGIVALAGLYLALGAAASSTTPPRPVGAEDDDTEAALEPRLTLVHPHGVVCVANAVMCAGDRAWNGARRRRLGAPHFLVAGTVAWLGDLMNRAFGCRCSSASRASVAALMRANKDLYLYPGGFVELARHSYAKDVVDVGSRGAIRLALEHGYAVRVAFAFGERRTAYALHGPRVLSRFRLWLARRGIPAVVAVLLPFAATPRVAFSPTMRFPRLDRAELTDDTVEYWHAAYVAALRALHAAHKRPDDVLVVHDEYSPARNPRENKGR